MSWRPERFTIRRGRVNGKMVIGRFDAIEVQDAAGKTTTTVRPDFDNFRGVARIQRAAPDADNNPQLVLGDTKSIRKPESLEPGEQQLYRGIKEDTESNFLVMIRDYDESGNALPSYSAIPVDEWYTFSKDSGLPQMSVEDSELLFEHQQSLPPRRSRAAKLYERMAEKEGTEVIETNDGEEAAFDEAAADPSAAGRREGARIHQSAAEHAVPMLGGVLVADKFTRVQVDDDNPDESYRSEFVERMNQQRGLDSKLGKRSWGGIHGSERVDFEDDKEDEEDVLDQHLQGEEDTAAIDFDEDFADDDVGPETEDRDTLQKLETELLYNDEDEEEEEEEEKGDGEEGEGEEGEGEEGEGEEGEGEEGGKKRKRKRKRKRGKGGSDDAAGETPKAKRARVEEVLAQTGGAQSKSAKMQECESVLREWLTRQGNRVAARTVRKFFKSAQRDRDTASVNLLKKLFAQKTSRVDPPGQEPYYELRKGSSL